MNHMKTFYPELYKNVYWGNFKGDERFDNIYPNRNQFIHDFSIDVTKKAPESVNKVMWDLTHRNPRVFDHMEGYVTLHGSYIMIFSTYQIREKEKELVESYGFKQIYNLYVASAKTFLVEINDIRLD